VVILAVRQRRQHPNPTMHNRLPIALLCIRISVFLVMLVWSLDKFVAPQHGVEVFQYFYFLPGLSPGMINAIGVLQLILITVFVLGIARRLSYGIVLLTHAVATVTPFALYLDPWAAGSPNILFFAAWPMLAACFALYLLRADDRLLRVNIPLARWME